MYALDEYMTTDCKYQHFNPPITITNLDLKKLMEALANFCLCFIVFGGKMNINSWLLIILIIQNIYILGKMDSPLTSITGNKSGIADINFSLYQIESNVRSIENILEDKTQNRTP